MTGDADEADEPLVACLDRRLERAARPERRLPLALVDEVVQLEQVDTVGLEQLERAPDLLACGPVLALAGLGREEEVRAVLAHPRPDPELGVAVARSRVDVVDAVLEQELERAVRLVLRGLAERGCAEQRPRADVPGRAEGELLDHALEIS